MNKKLIGQIITFFNIIIVCGFLIVMTKMFLSVIDGVTVINYDGWEHKCQAAGGFTYKTLCLDPTALKEIK